MSIVSDNNLKNSLTQVKGKMDEGFSSIDSRLGKLNYAQKMLKDGDAKYLFGTSISTWNASTGNTAFSANTSFLSAFNLIDTNAEGYISLENGVLTLKKGLTYKVEIHIFSNSNSGAFILIDKDRSDISSIWNTSYTDAAKPWYGNAGRLSTSSFSNTPVSAVIDATDGEKNLIAVLSDRCSIWNHCSYFFVQVLNPCVVDPVEHTNNKDGPEDTPVGHIISYMGNTAPKHYLFCDGSEYNIDDYKYLVQHFKDEFGSANYFGGDGTTTFAVPDLRGEFLRGAGENSHEKQGSGAEVGIHQDGTEHLDINRGTNAVFFGGRPSVSVEKTVKNEDYRTTAGKNGNNYYGWYSPATVNETISLPRYTNYTSRPTNTSVMYCIKYEPAYYMNVNTSLENNYSVNEQQIGYWIDGKKLYQKTITVSNIKIANGVTVSHGIDNPDMMNLKSAILKDETASPTRYASSESGSIGSTSTPLGFRCQGDNIICHTNTSWDASAKRTWYFTIQYTKTTD